MPMEKKVRVLIVDDSLFFRTALQKALLGDASVQVVGGAGSAAEAEKKIEALSPDVMTLDVEMAGMKGTDFLKQLIPVHPLPVVLVSSMNIGLFEALHAGAVDFVKKPEIRSSGDFEVFGRELAAKIKVASTAKVRRSPALVRLPGVPLLQRSTARETVIAIGASTGGTEATAAILQRLPADVPGIVVVQHMPAGFTKMYADRLDKVCHVSASEARTGDRVTMGHVLVAPGDKHMTVHRDTAGYYVRCEADEKVSGHCPSVDVLFRSVAKAAGKDAVGVILTGMGRDGAAGLLEMRKAGAYTIGQDRQSSVVYGMPMEAFELGAVTKQLPCRDIAAEIIAFLTQDPLRRR